LQFEVTFCPLQKPDCSRDLIGVHGKDRFY
jgi:hypothetical protein